MKLLKQKKKSDHDLTINNRKFELNQSGINSFLRCAEQFRRRYIEGHIIPPGIAAVRGTSIHVAARQNFKSKLITGQDLPKKDLIEMAVETLKSSVKADGILMTETEKSMGKDVIVNDAEKTVVALTGLFRDEVAPAIMPKLIEHKHEFKLPSGISVRGTVDVSTADRLIIDLKSKSKRGNLSDYENSAQTTMYHMLDALVEGSPPKAVVIEELIDTQTPKRQQFIITKRKEDYIALLNQVDAVAGSIKAGNFVGAYGQQGAWWCSKDRCGYWATCKFVPEHKR